MTLICPICQVEYRVAKNGVIMVAMSTQGPTQIVHADLYQCPCCGNQAVGGLASNPEKFSWESDFEELLDAYEIDPSVRVIKYWGSEREKTLYLQSRAGVS